MLPGRKYVPEDFLRMAWNRKWLILIPTILISVGTAVTTYFLPDRYRSHTTILIVPQRVPEDYVRSTVTSRVDERLNIISQQILSRTRLERIVQEFNLYERERETDIMEDVIQRMRGDISVNIATGGRNRNQDTNAFTVSFESSDARTAMLVTERLASHFVRENLEDRELLADATNQFLEAQMEDARRRLQEQEQKLAAYNRQYSGELPSQSSSNLQTLQSAQFRLFSLVDEISRDQDRALLLDREIADLMTIAEDPEQAAAVATANGDAANATYAQQLENVRTQLRALELRYTPEYPDIRRLKGVISELEVKAAEEARQLSATGTPAALSPGQRTLQSRLAQMRQELQTVVLRLESNKREKERLDSVVAATQARIDATPTRQSQLTELTRDYSTLLASYTGLLAKSEESKIAVNLERRQIGEQFKILDGARLPERPVSPNRPRMNAMGLLGGLGFGLALVALLEYRDTSLKTDSDVSVSLALPVLAVIPMMITTDDRKRLRRRRRIIGALTTATVAAAAFAIAVFLPDISRVWGP